MLPEGRVVKSECPRCEVSYRMFLARVRRQLQWISFRFGRGEPMILSAVLTSRCKCFFSAAVQLECHTVQQ